MVIKITVYSKLIIASKGSLRVPYLISVFILIDHPMDIRIPHSVQQTPYAH